MKSYTQLLEQIRQLFPYATDVRIEVDTTTADMDNLPLDTGTSFIKVTTPVQDKVTITTPYGSINIRNNGR